MRLIFQGLLIAALVAAACGAEAGGQPPAVALATGGRALLPIVVGENASERTRAAAATLGAYLGRITGAAFDVKTAADGRGIAVGLARDFPESPLAGRWSELKSTEREDYLLRTAADGVYLLGATELAVEHAVWDFLYRLGPASSCRVSRQIVPRISEFGGPDAEDRPTTSPGNGTASSLGLNADRMPMVRRTGPIKYRRDGPPGGLIRGLRPSSTHPEFYAWSTESATSAARRSSASAIRNCALVA